MYTVYKTTNIINRKIYIGVHKTNNPNDSYLGSGIYIKEAIKKYGKENFKKVILYEYTNKEDAYKKEKELVTKHFVNSKETYNLTEGGIPTIDVPNERRETHSKNMSGKNHPMYGKKHKPETIEKIRKSSKGRIFSEESKRKISEHNIGKTSWLKGHKRPIEHNKKTSISHLAKEKLQCPHCLKWCSPSNAKGFHFDKCKFFLNIFGTTFFDQCSTV